MDEVITTAFITLLLAGAWLDLRTRKIPNDLTVGALMIGLGLRAVIAIKAGSASAVLSGLGGAGLSFAFLFPLFAIGAMGGGDVKFSIAAGAFLGIERVLLALLLSAVAGGALGLITAVRRGVLLPVLVNCRDLLVHCVTFGRGGARPTLDGQAAITIPYGVAIALGSLAGWLL
ncbi:MAG TPA: prepilin peptidase [Longimicrobiales bacterium]|nr:prepilin peptidase [Longimicrobiales bacterium]